MLGRHTDNGLLSDVMLRDNGVVTFVNAVHSRRQSSPIVA
jgi:hypothetical protein